MELEPSGVTFPTQALVSKRTTFCIALALLLSAAVIPQIYQSVFSRTIGEATWIREANKEIQEIELEANAEMEYVEHEIELDPTVVAASLQSTAKLLSTFVLGVFAAKHCNVLDFPAIDALAKLVYFMFFPALMLCSIAHALSAETNGLSHLSLFFIMPLSSIVHMLLGYLLGKIMAIGLSEINRRDVMVCTTFNNSSALPLIFVGSLFPHGSRDLSDATACISFYCICMSPIFYTYGLEILLTHEEREDNSKESRNKTKSWTKICNPPVIASLLGMAIGTMPLLRELFLNDSGIGHPTFSALHTYGQAFLPATILVLAGSMVATVTPIITDTEMKKNPYASSVQNRNIAATVTTRVVLSIALARFFILPLITTSACHYFLPSLISHETPRNQALIKLVILIEGAMPPAQNMVLLLQMVGHKERASRMTRLLTFVYALSTIPTTIWVSRALTVSGLLVRRS